MNIYKNQIPPAFFKKSQSEVWQASNDFIAYLNYLEENAQAIPDMEKEEIAEKLSDIVQKIQGILQAFNML